MEAKMSFSGELIKELSEKIPSNIIAVNELIKNSYDAGADNVFLKIDTDKNNLIIQDDGEGMDNKDIESLFHISKSNKKFGEINKYKRYTQGSKGLGFLSVFKFGSVVKWQTNKNKGYEFVLKYDDFLKNQNLENYKIQIKENFKIKKGTKIQIEIKENEIQAISQYFADERNALKIVNSFCDKNFNINLEVGVAKYQTATKEFMDTVNKEDQILKINYNSSSNELNFYKNNQLLRTLNYPFKKQDFRIELELIAFKLRPYGAKKISKLYHKENDSITPLVYINNNLFNNYEIFDPDITRSKRSGESLNQLIGKVLVYSQNKDLEFNSDRSQFIQNQLTNNIKETLKEINIFLQKEGAKLKNSHQSKPKDKNYSNASEQSNDNSLFSGSSENKELEDQEVKEPKKDELEIKELDKSKSESKNTPTIPLTKTTRTNVSPPEDLKSFTKGIKLNNENERKKVLDSILREIEFIGKNIPKDKRECISISLTLLTRSLLENIIIYAAIEKNLKPLVDQRATFKSLTSLIEEETLKKIFQNNFKYIKEIIFKRKKIENHLIPIDLIETINSYPHNPMYNKVKYLSLEPLLLELKDFIKNKLN